MAIRYFFRALMILGICNLSSFHYVNPSLIPYTNETQNIIETYCTGKIYKYVSSVIDFNNLEDDEIGVCNFGKNVYTIEIDKRFWGVATENEKFQLVTHEMTHCLLHVLHLDKKDNYMYPIFTDIPKEKVISQLKEICK